LRLIANDDDIAGGEITFIEGSLDWKGGSLRRQFERQRLFRLWAEAE